MESERLRYTVGQMLNQEKPGVNPDEAKRKFDAFVRSTATGHTANPLTAAEAWVLGEPPCSKDFLPPDISGLLGLEAKTTYGDAYVEATSECYVQGRMKSTVDRISRGGRNQ